MAPAYQDYLAAQLVSEGNIVTYRSLSRALKVHANTAKQMLYEFHRSQNERKPYSLTATYLLSGTRTVALSSSTAKTNGTSSTGGKDSQDIEMGDSFVFSSSLPDTAAAEQEAAESQQERSETVPIKTVTLVQEADLDTIRGTYTTLDSIHVYALSPSPLKNLGTLSAANQSATVTTTTQEDPLETYKIYGTIHNPHTKRRTSKRPNNATAPAAPATTAAMKGAAAKSATTATTQSAAAAAAAAAASKPSTTTSSTTTAPTKPPMKKQSSNIMSSFAKQPATATKPPVEDSPMRDASDDEGTDADFAPGVDVDANTTVAKEKAEATRQARKDREEKLKQMMEAESESDKEEGGDAQEDDAPLEEDEWPASPPPEERTNSNTQASREGESQNTQADAQGAANGKLRGRRRVIKKKKVTDDEGFIVTKEESEWESFSEDEGPPATVASGNNLASKGGEKSKAVSKSAPKGGDKKSGNIMSFFAKK